MKSVLISIKPVWCSKIVSGEKTLEIRKNKPKLETPFKCYIYCTKDKPDLICNNPQLSTYEYLRTGTKVNGTVIGEFICDNIVDLRDVGGEEFYEKSRMTMDDWVHYTYHCRGIFWGWHISDFVLYDKPKELSEFYCRKQLTRPPQSWCYVEHN